MSRGFCCSKIITRETHWLLMALAALMIHDEVFFDDVSQWWCKPLTDTQLWLERARLNCWPCHPQWAGVEYAQLLVSPSCSLVGHWLLSKIDACNRRAVNSIYSVLILFNPIHISVSEAWQDVRSHRASRKIFLGTVRTK